MRAAAIEYPTGKSPTNTLIALPTKLTKATGGADGLSLLHHRRTACDGESLVHTYCGTRSEQSSPLIIFMMSPLSQ
jgi:hypothetical protein